MSIFARLHLADLEHLSFMRSCCVCLVEAVLLLLSFLGQTCWNKSNCSLFLSLSYIIPDDHWEAVFWNLPLSPLTAPTSSYAVPVKEKSTLYRLIGETAATTAAANTSSAMKSLGNVCVFGFCMGPFAKSESFDPTGRKITVQIHKLLMCNEARNWWLCKFYSKKFWPQKTPPKELTFISRDSSNHLKGWVLPVFLFSSSLSARERDQG